MVWNKTAACFKIIILIFIVAWYVFFLAEKIDLTTADLGRHLKNGELLLANWESGILKSNFYSYTNPDYPVINHHWLSGIIFFLVLKLSGFAELSLFYIILNAAAFLLFFDAAKKNACFKIAALLSLVLIPLMASRTEIRPEVFSYFFSALFFWILWNYKNNLISGRWLYVLPAAELFWVNTHIYFILGIFLVGVFLFEELCFSFVKFMKEREMENEPRRNTPTFLSMLRCCLFEKQIKKLGVIFFLTGLASFINPFGAKAVFYPFKIFSNYGYPIVENQSVAFLERIDFILPNFILFKIAFLLLLASFIFAAFKNYKKISIANLCFGAAFGAMAWLAIRNFPFFGFFALPIMADNIKIITYKKLGQNTNAGNRVTYICIVIFILAILFAGYNTYAIKKNRLEKAGVGLTSQNSGSAGFFSAEGGKGPIFNNYDIGGYLIYYLYPEERVFTDNRPEAYPTDFFQKIYIPMQQNPAVWREQDKLYNFNAVFFSHRDYTPWGRQFLVELMKNPDWVQVYIDQYAAIFLRRNELNAPLIKKFEKNILKN